MVCGTKKSAIGAWLRAWEGVILRRNFVVPFVICSTPGRLPVSRRCPGAARATVTGANQALASGSPDNNPVLATADETAALYRKVVGAE